MHVRLTGEEGRWLAGLRSRVRAARRERAWSQEQLAERAELSVDMVSRVERGTRVPSLPVLRRIARAMDMTMDALLRDQEAVSPAQNLPGIWRASVPLLGAVSAGLPELALQDDEAALIPVPPGCGVVDFALRVRGESMWGAGILEGDIVLVRRGVPYRNGDIVVALIDDEALVKRLQVADEAYLLLAENPRYPARAAPAERSQLLGVVVSVLRTVDGE